MSNGHFTDVFRFVYPIVLFSILLSSCQKDLLNVNESQRQANLQIRFSPTVDGSKLILGKSYKNAFTEEYSITTFKFYIHRIELMNSQTNTSFQVDKSQHYLVNLTDSSTSYIELAVPSATFDRIGFVIGVDSIWNVSGAQTGALDPAQGMFWTWSTGYIMAKLEGNSPAAATPDQVIEYHIGGFKGADNVLRKIILDFPASQTIDLKQRNLSTITITANINSWFHQVNPVRISENPVSMTPGTLAAKIADNYSKMFTVVQVVNE